MASQARKKAYDILMAGSRDAPKLRESLSFAATLASRGFSSSAYYSLFPYLLVFLTDAFHLDVWLGGMVVAAMLMAARGLAIPAGHFVDRHGPRPVIIASNLASAVAILALTTVSHSAAMLVIALLLFRGAIASGQNVAYQVVTYRHFDEAMLVKGYGYLGMAANLGVIAGPVATTLVGPTSLAALLVPAVFHGLSACAALFIRLEPRRKRAGDEDLKPSGEQSENGSPRQALSLPFMIAYAAQWLLLQQIVLSFAYYCTNVMGQSRLSGLFFGLQGALIIPTLYFATPRLATFASRDRPAIFIGGCILLSLSYVIFGTLSLPFPLYAVLAFAVVLTASEALSVPIGDAHIAGSGNAASLGMTFSLVALLQSLGMTIGSVFGAALMWRLQKAGAAYLFWQLIGAGGLAIFLPTFLIALRSRSRTVVKTLVQ